MSVLDQAKNQIAETVAAALGGGLKVIAAEIVAPPDRSLGDLSFGCFGAAKFFKQSPAEIAKKIAAAFKPVGLLSAANAAGPYVNFKLNRAEFGTSLTKEILFAPEKWGQAAAPKKERVLIEYAQPNTHKELHVGHLRNLCLGLATVNLYRAAGFDVVPVGYIGDIGAHVAKCLWCLKQYHADELKRPPADKGAWLGRIYAEATRRADADEKSQQEIAAVQRKLEARDSEWQKLWEATRRWSLAEFETVFKELGIVLDRWYFESEVEEAGKKLAQSLLKKGIAQVGEKGALIIDLEKFGLSICLILKSDGSALYMTKELALAQLKFKEYPDAAASIHIVDSRQSLYFKQFFKALELLGFSKKLTHLAYEFVTLKEGAMSSRQGNIVSYEDFRDEVVRQASAETRKRRADWGESRVQETAWLVAESAMKFGMLKQDPDKPIVFDIDSALAFDGFTGPYVQYAHARLSSILEKVGGASAVKPVAGSDDPAEFAALFEAGRFPEIVAEAAERNKPSVLAQYLFDLAQAASAFYRDVPVIAAPTPADRARRLAVVECLRLTLARGLNLLGIAAPAEM